MAGRFFRINQLQKKDDHTVISTLRKKGFSVQESFVPYSYEIISCPEDFKISETEEFINGEIYIQDISSQVPPHILSPAANQKVLDLCASPGSKTTQIASLMENKGFVVANEPNDRRVGRLYFNLKNQGTENTILTNIRGEEISRYFDHFFDKILVDPPCSSLGTEQKSPGIADTWNRKRSASLARTQKKLLTSAFFTLRVGGELVYSTCTTRREENEDVVEWFLRRFSSKCDLVDIRIAFPALSPYFSDEKISDKGMRFPEILERTIRLGILGEGFFVAKIRKTSETYQSQFRRDAKFDLSIFETIEELEDYCDISMHGKSFRIHKTASDILRSGFVSKFTLVEMK